MLTATRFFLAERDSQGTPLTEARCDACNGDAPAFSVPNNNGDRYQYLLYIETHTVRMLFLPPILFILLVNTL